MSSVLYLLYPVFQPFKVLFIKIEILLGNNDGCVGNLRGPFNLLVRLNAHGVLSVIHDSLISAGVITVYEQSVSVKQISRSVNYSPFWDLCKSQWRNSSACHVWVRVVFQQLGVVWFILSIPPFLSPHFLCWARICLQSVAHKGFYSSPGSRGCHGGMSRGQIIRFRWSLCLLQSASPVLTPNSFSRWYSLISFNQSNQWLN